MPCELRDFHGRHSDSPQEQRRYLQSLGSNLPNDRPRDSEDEKMQEFHRRWLAGELFKPVEKSVPDETTEKSRL